MGDTFLHIQFLFSFLCVCISRFHFTPRSGFMFCVSFFWFSFFTVAIFHPNLTSRNVFESVHAQIEPWHRWGEDMLPSAICANGEYKDITTTLWANSMANNHSLSKFDGYYRRKGLKDTTIFSVLSIWIHETNCFVIPRGFAYFFGLGWNSTTLTLGFRRNHETNCFVICKN